MSGMLMMMKSMGFDPEEMKKNVEAFKVEIETKITTVDNRLKAIEVQQKQILFFVEQVYNACLNEVSAPQKLSTSFIVGDGSQAEENFRQEIADAVKIPS